MAAAGRSSSSEPTEAPSAARLAEARRRGEVALSADLVTAGVLAAAGLALVALAPRALTSVVAMVRAGLSTAVAPSGEGGFAPGVALSTAFAVGARLVLPLAAIAATGALAIGLLQTRGVLRPPAWGGSTRGEGGPPRPGRWLAIARDVSKVAVVVAVAWITLREALPTVLGLTGASATQVATVAGALASRLALRLVGTVALLAAVDYLLIWRAHGRRLRMTREELRQERRRTEGDERVRAWRRQQHRALAAGGDEADLVASADFVVTGDGPSALALRYDRGGPRAPLVVARALAEGVEAILRQAETAGVRIIQDAALARALETIPVGSEIPAAQYDAVAALLRAKESPSTARADAPVVP